MSEHQIQFDVTQGPWRITASYADKDNIAIYRDGEHYRTTTYPAYKIWNIAAHLAEVITGLEAERHEFQPVAGHPDDDECTFRADGTDETYCGLPSHYHRLEGDRHD